MSEVLNGPHQDKPKASKGLSLQKAKAAMIMIHGRGASAESIVQLSDEFGFPEVHYVAPQAGGHTWYPYSFLAGINMNEPGISSGIKAIDELRKEINDSGIPNERIFFLGFSQGACLTLEYVARHPDKYAGVFALTGGLIGPEVSLSNYEGNLMETPIFIGSSDIDPHVPLERVNESEYILSELGGRVNKVIYPGMGHFVNEDEIKQVRSIMAQTLS